MIRAVPRLLLSLLALSLAGLAGARHNYGLTAYGEPCTDSCKQRGFPYAWCHKKPSWNGTYLNRDYCSPEFGKTRYLQTCLDNCERRDGKPFYWCHTRHTPRGDWDFCSPFPGDSCQWSSWGGWGGCSTSCGPGSRTRRRRMEGSQGRVGDCSGETEVAFQACNDQPCAGFGSSCQWAQWSSWEACSVTCGPGGERRRYRLLTQTGAQGTVCAGETSQTQACPYYPCPLSQDTETNNTSQVSPLIGGVKRLLGEFEHPLHGVSGKVYLTPKQDKLLIEDFTYDGRGPDAFFWVGREGSPGARSSVVLPHPFRGKFFDYRDPAVPRLAASNKEDIVLTLPPQLSAYNIKWISVWCRKFSVDFGHVIIDEKDNGHDFLLDNGVNNVINNITVELPSFTGQTTTTTPTPTTPPGPGTTVQEADDETISNEIQDVTRDPEIITVELPDLSQISEQPRSLGGTRGKQRTVTYSVGNELSDLGWEGREEQKTKHKDHRLHSQDQAKDDQTFSVKLDKMREKKKMLKKKMKDEKDVGFTVIRVESSVSQLEEAAVDTEDENEDNDDIQEGGAGVTPADTLEEDEPEEEAESEMERRTTEMEARPTTTASSTEVSGFSIDKLIEVTLSNIDGVSKLSTVNLSAATTKGLQTTTEASEETEETDTTPASAEDRETTTKKAQTRFSPFKKPTFRPPTTESQLKRRPSLFKTPEQRSRDRISALFNRVTSPKTTTVDNLFTDEFVTSTPKTRRFSIAPRFTTPSPGSDETNEESGRISGQPSFSTATNSNKSTFRPKIVDLLNEIPTDDSENAIDDKDDNIINLSTSSLSPHELFSLIPRVTETATVKLGDFVIPVSTLHPPRLPPLRTTPSSSLPSRSTSRSGISARPRATTVIDLDITPGITTTESSVESSSPRRSGLFVPSRRPGSLFSRRPGLARSTTVSTPLTTPKLKTRKLQERIRNIFTRRRSTTVKPETEDTEPPAVEDTESTDDNDTNLSGNVPVNDGQNSIFGDKPGEDDDETADTDLNDVNVENDRRKLFESKFRPRRPTLPRRKFTPRPSLVRTREPAPRTTARSDSLPPFTTPRLGPATSPEPAPVTTPKRMSEDERFQIFTDFMKKTENMTTLKDTEITTVSGLSTIEDGGVSVSTLQDDFAERPRSSATVAGRNNIGRERIKQNRNKFGVSKKWESGRVTPSLFESSSPTPVSIFQPSVTPVSIFRSSPTPVPIFRSTDATLEIDLDEFYSDDYEEEEEVPSPAPFLPTVSPTPRSPPSPSSPATISPDNGYNPCDIRGSCGPNARCNSVNNEPTCSCPSGFSGIPRNGSPDPQHGCVRTPVGCGAGNSTSCDSGHSCVRDVCLQSCQTDTNCALGERCITETADGLSSRVCIKICFYDAHCLAGEYCEENVCRPGCRSDSNCPFGQICATGPEESIRECENGCHFSNDCPIGQECRDGQCRDPCQGFQECGTNAVCVPVNHLPTCKCPDGYKELNSPYDACVVASADLTLLECLEDSDCGRGECRQGVCVP